jgi:transposase
MAQKNQSKSRRRYDASFKAEVIQMIANGRSVPEVARSLGVGENIIYRWRNKALGGSEASPAGTGCGTAPAQVSLSEHLALQKRLRELELERDILKKVVGIFSRPQ